MNSFARHKSWQCCYIWHVHLYTYHSCTERSNNLPKVTVNRRQRQKLSLNILISESIFGSHVYFIFFSSFILLYNTILVLPYITGIAMSIKCTGHSKHPLPTTQEKTLHIDITRWSTSKSDWLYSFQPKMEKLYTVSKKIKKTRSWLWLRSGNPYCQIQTGIEESRENH